MIDFNPTREKYYVQTNNKLSPFDACQCTASTECIDILGYVDKLIGDYDQPEDNLYAYCGTDAMLKYTVLSHGVNWKKSVGYPAEWADVLVKAINEMVGFKLASFKDNFTYDNVIKNLLGGKPMIASMRYDKIPGHYVCVVGFTDAGQLIIDDPYKNDLLNTPDGYHNLYALSDWVAHSKGYGIVFNRSIA